MMKSGKVSAEIKSAQFRGCDRGKLTVGSHKWHSSEHSEEGLHFQVRCRGRLNKTRMVNGLDPRSTFLYPLLKINISDTAGCLRLLAGIPGCCEPDDT